MTFPVRKSARKLTGIVKNTIPEIFPEMKPLGNVIIFLVATDENVDIYLIRQYFTNDAWLMFYRKRKYSVFVS